MTSVIVTFSNGDRFSIPAGVFAHDRAAYYAQIDADAGENYDETYAKEYDITLSEPEELLDWLHNNTDWIDVRDRATPIQGDPVVVNYSEEWANVSAQVVWTKEDRSG